MAFVVFLAHRSPSTRHPQHRMLEAIACREIRALQGVFKCLVRGVLVQDSKPDFGM